MSSIEPGTWMESRVHPRVYLEVLAVIGDEEVRVRDAFGDVTTTKAVLRATWIPMGDDS
ncbi:hypothetical protein [Curtobacterium sp. MCSS17_006]|uniref:hypothetical protein n=1 Tax=Curtobacterium sp. MCSS17_006 TaxID=2175642 RepID=UPI0015E8E512|nr:hypothetical protein [Curtobacterium sp. MCSS17_006]